MKERKKNQSQTSEISKGIILADVITAKQAIEYFKESKNKDIKNIGAYHIQQAVEKLIKLQIYDSGKKIDNSKTYTHSIKKLIKYGEELGLGLNIPKPIAENAQMITDWEAGSRYGLVERPGSIFGGEVPRHFNRSQPTRLNLSTDVYLDALYNISRCFSCSIFQISV